MSDVPCLLEIHKRVYSVLMRSVQFVMVQQEATGLSKKATWWAMLSALTRPPQPAAFDGFFLEAGLKSRGTFLQQRCSTDCYTRFWSRGGALKGCLVAKWQWQS